MAQRHKGKNGDGAKTPMQTSGQQDMSAQNAEPSGRMNRTSDYPLSRFRQELDSLFDRFFAPWPMSFEGPIASERLWDVDMEDTEKGLRLRMPVPGFEPQDFDINVSGNILMVKAEHNREQQENMEGGQKTEQCYDHFQRSITLPTAVDPEKVEAHCRNGMLELCLPRTEEAQRRRIEVKA
jgi:HSP20 family protein